MSDGDHRMFRTVGPAFFYVCLFQSPLFFALSSEYSVEEMGFIAYRSCTKGPEPCVAGLKHKHGVWISLSVKAPSVQTIFRKSLFIHTIYSLASTRGAGALSQKCRAGLIFPSLSLRLIHTSDPTHRRFVFEERPAKCICLER